MMRAGMLCCCASHCTLRAAAHRLPPLHAQLYLSGESAGGMMVQVLLCQKPRVADAVTAAADIMGGIGAEYSASAACADSHAVPFLKLHGETRAAAAPAAPACR